MIDQRDNREPESPSNRSTSSTKNNYNSNNKNDAASQSASKKREASSKRSIFSVFFHSPKSSSSKSSSSDKEPEVSEGLEADDDDSGGEGEEGEDISTSLSADLSDKWPLAKRQLGKQHQQQQPSDNDSYVLDLNKRLESEKKQGGMLRRTFSFRSRNSKKSNEKKKGFSRQNSTPDGQKKNERVGIESRKKDSIEEREEESAKDSWHSNDNYIPVAAFAAAKVEKNNNNNNLLITDFKEVDKQANRKPTSPLLKEFIDSHRLKFGTKVSNLNGSSYFIGDNTSNDTSSSTDSLFATAPLSGNNYNLGPNDWRLLDTKWSTSSAANNQNYFTSLFLQSSESELDLLDCQAPCSTCSDDTSCSSVELVWSRSTGATRASSFRDQSPRFLTMLNEQQRRSTSCNSTGSSVAIPETGTESPVVSSLPQQVASRQRILQRLSIFELAKPSRAKGKRFGERKSAASRRRKSCEEPKQPADTTSNNNYNNNNNRSSVQWVANPLFSDDKESEVEGEEEPATRTRATNNTNVDVNTNTNTYATITTTTTNSTETGTIVEPTGTMEKQRLRHSASHESVMRQRVLQVALPWNKRWLGYKSSTSSEMQRLKRQQKQQKRSSIEDLDSDTSISLDFSLSNSENDNSILVDDEFERYDRFGDADSSSTYHLDRQANGKRCSVLRSPFKVAGNNNNNNTSEKRLYLNHIANLDKRIKSNVSSIKSQLSEKISDTSKRASMLADQLLSSIKDTTKEQLLASTVWGARDRRNSDSMPNSFISSSRSLTDGLSVDGRKSPALTANSCPSSEESQRKKAELFSLIYQHQQHANGQPVITRQPVEGVKSRLFASGNNTAQKPAVQKPAVPPRPKSLDRRMLGLSRRDDSRNRENHILKPQQPTHVEEEEEEAQAAKAATSGGLGSGNINQRVVWHMARKYSDPVAPGANKLTLHQRSNTISLGNLGRLSGDGNGISVDSETNTKENQKAVSTGKLVLSRISRVTGTEDINAQCSAE